MTLTEARVSRGMGEGGVKLHVVGIAGGGGGGMSQRACRWGDELYGKLRCEVGGGAWPLKLGSETRNNRVASVTFATRYIRLCARTGRGIRYLSHHTTGLIGVLMHHTVTSRQFRIRSEPYGPRNHANKDMVG